MVAIMRMTLQGTARHPLAWILAALALALPALFTHFTPLVPSPSSAFDPLSVLAPPLAGIAAMGTLLYLARLEGFLRLLPPGIRLGGEFLGLFATMVSLHGILALGAMVGGGEPLAGPALMGIMTLDLHLAALATLAQRLPVSPASRGFALLAAGWLLPGFMPTPFRVLDPTQHLARVSAGDPGALALGLAPIAGLLLVVALLSAKSGAADR